MSFTERLRAAMSAVLTPGTVPTGEATELNPADVAELESQVDTALRGQIRNGMTQEQIEALRVQIAARMLGG